MVLTESHKKTIGAVVLIVLTCTSLGILLLYLPDLEKRLSVEVTVPWDNKKDLVLRSGPAWFLYDKATGVLKASRPVQDMAKRELLELLDDAKADPSYQQAVDRLAYSSNEKTKSDAVLFYVLLLGILCGILGVLIRSLSSFVFHACVQRDLDLSIWWPWYALRPFLGAAVGVTLIVLLKSQLINVTQPEQFAGFWLLGLCIIAGFGVDEFANRLFYLARTIFGESSEGGANKPAENTEKLTGQVAPPAKQSQLPAALDSSGTPGNP